jgi:hypothetical protein
MSEFVCIPDEILRSRFEKLTRISDNGKKIELTLWLMPDRKIYDCTNSSIEFEWYYLSQSTGGRMADGTEWDYTEYLNNWDYIEHES